MTGAPGLSSGDELYPIELVQHGAMEALQMLRPKFNHICGEIERP
jgi:hypothetical protein